MKRIDKQPFVFGACAVVLVAAAASRHELSGITSPPQVYYATVPMDKPFQMIRRCPINGSCSGDQTRTLVIRESSFLMTSIVATG